MAAASPGSPQERVFGWDALQKEVTAKLGETNVHFRFSLTNLATKTVTITGVRTSCGCTVARLPQTPWSFQPGESGSFGVDLDLRGKVGIVTKTVTVESSEGFRYLTVRASVPPTPRREMSDAERVRNLQVSLVDRRAVFRGDCVTCHVTPGVQKNGKELFHSVCGVCHEAEHRASMVPDLRRLGKPQDAGYWRAWINQGKEATLMPGWAAAEGGPLTPEQVDSLIAYLTGAFKTEPTIRRGAVAIRSGR